MSSKTAKKKLSNISFEKEGAHVALVSKDQGGPANGHNYTLIMKANNFSQEYIEKIQQVQVTMEFPEFLRKFFNLYYEDAEILARFLGYVPEEKEDDWNYEDYIQEKVDSFKVLKALNEAENLEIALGKLTQEEALLVKQSQAKLETVLEKNSANADEGSTEAVAKAKKSGDETNAVVEPSGETNVEENSMDEEKVEKSALTAVQKSLDEALADLQKATARIAEFEAKEKEAIVKAKTSVIQDILKDEKSTAVIAKAALLIEGDDFTAFVDVLKGLMQKVEKSSLFEEQGASGESGVKEDTKESLVAKALKAELAKSTTQK